MFRGRGRESSTGRLAHPPHSMRVTEACSAAAARGTDLVSPHCRPCITKVHSEAACAVPTQSPSAALIGYDGTTLFHHVAYAASYTARLATWQTMPLATPGKDLIPGFSCFARRNLLSGIAMPCLVETAPGRSLRRSLPRS